MKFFFPLILAVTLQLSACDFVSNEQAKEQSPLATTDSVYHYRCNSGETIAATYPTTDSASVEYKGSRYHMRIAVSGSGSRYVGSGLEWWTKGSGPGSEGTLFRHLVDGTTGQSIEFCMLP